MFSPEKPEDRHGLGTVFLPWINDELKLKLNTYLLSTLTRLLCCAAVGTRSTRQCKESTHERHGTRAAPYYPINIYIICVLLDVEGCLLLLHGITHRVATDTAHPQITQRVSVIPIKVGSA